jgi:autotransporter translocation and assembly factor TamB
MRLSEGDVEVHLVANRFPLSALSPLLDPREIGEMQGTLDLDAHLEGRRRELTGSGTIALTQGVVPLPGLGVTYREIDVSGELRANDLVIHRAHVESEKGSLDVSGQVRFVSAARVEPNLHVSAKRFTFADSRDLRAAGSAELDVTGTVTAPVVKGTARIENSSYNLTQPQVATAGVDTSLKLTDADVQMMEEAFGFVEAPDPGLSRRFYDASDLDLQITLERDNWLRQRAQPRLAVALTGDFHLRKAPFGEPELLGRIELVPGRGYVEQFARSFDIVSGEVLLNGKMDSHTIDVEAQYKPPASSESDESDVIVRLDLDATSKRTDLVLSSEPAMSQEEIISYIATGRSRTVGAAPTGSSGDESTIAKDIGLSQVTGGAEQAAQEAIGLDVLQIRFDALQGATLVAGRYLNSELYVGFRQPLQYKDSASPSSEDEFGTSFDVEYAVHRWLVLNLQGETSTLRSFIRARHAY